MLNRYEHVADDAQKQHVGKTVGDFSPQRLGKGLRLLEDRQILLQPYYWATGIIVCEVVIFPVDVLHATLRCVLKIARKKTISISGRIWRGPFVGHDAQRQIDPMLYPGNRQEALIGFDALPGSEDAGLE